MASNARKELAKALRVAFGADNSKDAPAPASFDDYEPPQALLDAIDEWANSSAIQNSTTDRDIAKLREALLEHCFEQGTIADLSSLERSTQARSAFIVVLERFSNLDSQVVSVREIRETWWNRLILPALTLPDTPSDTIRLSRAALKAAKDMTIRALNSAVTSTTSEADEATELDRTKAAKWTLSVFRACLRAPNESFAQKTLQNVLIAFGKAHPKHFFITIGELLDKPVEALGLLDNYVRLYPIQAYQALQTPLFSKIIAMLDSLPVSYPEGTAPSSDDIADKLVWVTAGLCTLNMLMARLPTSLDKLLDRFFIILARCLLWYDAVNQVMHPANAELTEDEEDSESENIEKQLSPRKTSRATPVLAPLLDYFTQLYGLFPANLVAFLAAPTRWLQAYYRRMRKRRHRTPSSANLSALGRDALLRPLAAAGGLTTYSSSSTSGDEDASATDLPMSGAEEGDGDLAAQMRKKRASKTGGRKGQRSKTSKARRDMATKAKKEREVAKQKDRERRRRATNFLQNAPGQSTERDQANVSFPTSVDGVHSALSSSTASSSGPPSAISAEARTPKVRIQEPLEVAENEGPGEASCSATEDAEIHSTDSEEEGSEESETSMQGIEKDLQALDLEGALAVFDWQRVRELSGPYLLQHVVMPGLTENTEAEFTRNKIRFKKLEAPDLIDEITRTRIPQFWTHSTSTYDTSAGNSVASPPPSSLSGSTTMLGMSIDLLPENKQMSMMQNQLIFEVYQKNQLVQRLGSLLRERIATSGAEADKQNLMHQIRSLKSQLSHSQEKLEQLRHESALSRERLNKYSSDQSNRVEKLRGERIALNSENMTLKAELEDLKSSIVALNEELAESRKECFDLKSEQEYAKQLEQQRKAEEDEQSKKEASEEFTRQTEYVEGDGDGHGHGKPRDAQESEARVGNDQVETGAI